MSTPAWDFLVGRDDFHRTRVEPAIPPTPEDGELLLRVESFALTANNITYAVFGDQIGYWRFFLAPDGWGRIPAWGYAHVERSAHPEIAEGERFFGYFPMSTHMVARPRRTRGGFVDETPHRADLPAAYNQYQTAPPAEAHEDERAVLHPLFMTSFLIEDFLDENDYFGARSVILTSASSKTALGLAWCIRRRGRVPAVGLTSPRNRAFADGLGFYDKTVLYEALGEAAIETPAVLVDFAGDADLISGIHHRFGDDLAYSCLVGGTHWEADQRRLAGLPGPEPLFFFAPSRIAKRRQDWGPGGLEDRYGEVWPLFVADSPRWMRIAMQDGPAAVEAAYQAVLAGRSSPDQGIVCRP